jgi:hypothetical protein
LPSLLPAHQFSGCWLSRHPLTSSPLFSIPQISRALLSTYNVRNPRPLGPRQIPILRCLIKSLSKSDLLQTLSFSADAEEEENLPNTDLVAKSSKPDSDA